MIAFAIAVGRWILGLLRTPLGQIVLGAVVLLALLWLADLRGAARGVSQERGRWETRQAADAASAGAEAQRQAIAGARVGAQVEERQIQVRTVTQTLIKEVPRYVTVEADARCDVPVGFGRLHDAAAAGVPPAPDPAGRADEAPSGVALSAVAGTVVENYGACQQTAARLKGWQDWWAAVTAPTRHPAR